jgi:hypothetical protein
MPTPDSQTNAANGHPATSDREIRLAPPVVAVVDFWVQLAAIDRALARLYDAQRAGRAQLV